MDEQKDEGRKQYREFKVTPGLRGFKVTIGCCEVYFDSIRELGNIINAYFADPQGIEKKMLAEDHRQGPMLPPEPAQTTPGAYEPAQERAFAGLNQAIRR